MTADPNEPQASGKARSQSPKRSGPATAETSTSQSTSPVERGVVRILDANLNRALEGLRVAEDYARFVLDHADLATGCKTLRHELSQLLSERIDGARYGERNVAEDVGTAIEAPREYERESAEQVCRVNLQRAKEAVRVLEEYTKTQWPATAKAIEGLRYRLYELEQTFWGQGRRRELLQRAQLYVLIDAASSAAEFSARVKTLIDSGVDVVQLRDKQLDDRRLLRRAELLRELTAGSSCLMIVNDRPDVAWLSGADGVHVGQTELSSIQVRRLVGRQMLVGVSTHSLDQAVTAEGEGADYIGVGPVFASTTKSFDAWVGPSLVSEVVARVRIPSFAIGGIDSRNLPELTAVGCRRVAVSQAVWHAADPAAAVRELRSQLAS
ncbi:MAG: thiamine phosphate synthase [Pirellulales bacterium]